MAWIKKHKYYLLLALVAIPASFPLILPGFYEPHDLHHFADIYQMARSFESGQFPPRWAPDFLFGYGYPLFNFYYVLPFYMGALIFAILGSLQVSFKLVFLSTIIISIFGMYKFLRVFFGGWGAFAGSALFLYTPYRAVQIYVRGAMGEALALSILPWILFAVAKLIKKPSRKSVVTLAIAASLFILAHNYFWFLAGPFILLFIVLLTYQNKDKVKVYKSLILSGLLSIGLTSYWWIPALFEKHMIERLTPFLLVDHFPFIKQLIIPSWGYGSSVWGPGDEISFQIGIINLAVVVFAFALFLFRRKLFKNKTNTIFLWAVIGFLASMFMMNIRSLFIWKLIPFYNFIQFPWRLLVFTTLFTSVLLALLLEVRPLKSGYKWAISFGVVLIVIMLNVGYFKPSKVVYKSDNEYLLRFFANRTIEGEKNQVSDEYRQWSEDYLLLPNWVSEKPNDLPKAKFESDNASIIDIEQISPVHWRAQVSTEEDSEATFNTLYFPGWTGFVNGEEVELVPGEPYGQIVFEVGKGERLMEIRWKETALRKVADLISLISIIFLLKISFTKAIQIRFLR